MTTSEIELELKRVFREQKRRNADYSFRALAKDLDFNFSTLYRILSGDRRLGRHSAKELAPRLNVKFVESKTSPRQKKKEPFQLNRLNALNETHVHWLSLAILESIKLPDFKPTTTWIAKRFRIEAAVAESLLAKMEREGLLSRRNSDWRDLLEDAATSDPEILTSESVRRILRELMSASSETIESVPVAKREHSFALFPVSAKDLPKLKKKMVAMQREFGATASKSKSPKTEIYAFQQSFFPVTSKD